MLSRGDHLRDGDGGSVLLLGMDIHSVLNLEKSLREYMDRLGGKLFVLNLIISSSKNESL